MIQHFWQKMSKWVKPGSMGKVAPGYDVRIVNNMGKVTRQHV